MITDNARSMLETTDRDEGTSTSTHAPDTQNETADADEQSRICWWIGRSKGSGRL